MLPLKDDLHCDNSSDVFDVHDKSLRRQSPDPAMQKYQVQDEIEAPVNTSTLSLLTAP